MDGMQFEHPLHADHLVWLDPKTGQPCGRYAMNFSTTQDGARWIFRHVPDSHPSLSS